MSEQPISGYIEDDRINDATEFSSGDEIYPHMAKNVVSYAEFSAKQQAKEQARQAIAALELVETPVELTIESVEADLLRLAAVRNHYAPQPERKLAS